MKLQSVSSLASFLLHSIWFQSGSNPVPICIVQLLINFQNEHHEKKIYIMRTISTTGMIFTTYVPQYVPHPHAMGNHGNNDVIM